MSAAATAAGYLYASGRIGKKSRCEKTQYHTEAAALVNAAYRVSQGAPPLRIYLCDACRAYHLTSQPLGRFD